MSGLEPLVSIVYHEKQQLGSQLCAQHALNGVFQGDYFQAPDLAQLAQQLDTLEGSVNENAGPISNNMDDTGFFSVGVLERAVNALGFTLIRWRSERLRSQHDAPHHQMAFILNHQEHWFTLRRFGNLDDPENGHWFNLNSFLDAPEWVSKLYLGMVLAQAEDEGYSVFAVLPLGDNSETLPHTEADNLAATLPQPTSSNAGIRISTSHTHSGRNAPTSSKRPDVLQGFEDEDMELQAALQASLAADGAFDYATFSELNPHQRDQSSLPSPPQQQLNEATESIEASMARSLARNRQMMNRMQQEQEMALRETYENEIEDRFSEYRPPRRQTTGELEEEDALRQALEASRAGTIPHEDETSVDEEQILPQIIAAEPAPPTRNLDRVYDDEDADLQAALRASLEGLPEAHVAPTIDSAPITLPTSSQPKDERESPPVTAEASEKPPSPLDPEEIRRKRLARFGGGQ